MSFRSWREARQKNSNRSRLWRRFEVLEPSLGDPELADELTKLARLLHPAITINVSRNRKNRRVVVLHANGVEEALDETLLIYRRAPARWSHRVIQAHTPVEWLRQSYRVNRAFFETPKPAQFNWQAHPFYGAACLGFLEDALISRLMGRLDLEKKWLEVAASAVEESWSRVSDGLERLTVQTVYLAFAERLITLVQDGNYVGTHPIPFETFEREIRGMATGAEMDCQALICTSLAVLDADPRAFTIGVELMRKKEPDTSRERRLAKRFGCLFDNNGDESFWSDFREVLIRWLDPVVRTESEAELYSRPVRHSLSALWLLRRCHGSGPDDYLRVLAGEP